MVRLTLQGDGQALGCRAMTRRIRDSYDVQVTRDAVSTAQKNIAADAGASRKKQRLVRREYNVDGPNALWHFDQNDKMRQFGSEIHGCIDGWSRKMVWLHVGASNRIPEQILAYYVDAINLHHCMPSRQRSDRGAQNTLAAAVQMHYNGPESHIYGRSVANQLIESWWNQMYAYGIDFWIDYFKNLEANCLYDIDDEYQKRCSYVVFGPLIEETLDMVFTEWNGHMMRKSNKNPGGVPDFLYSNSELYGATDCRKPRPELLDQWVHAAFPDAQCDLNDLFNSNRDMAVVHAALQYGKLFPVTKQNVTECFLYLREQHHTIAPFLSKQ
jgi:hypothetical protein